MKWLKAHKILTIIFFVVVFSILGLTIVANLPLPAAQPPQPLAAKDVDITQLFSLTNKDRAASNIAPLALDGKLSQSAQDKCNDMVVKNYYAHNSPSGVQWIDTIKKYYPYFNLASENLNVVLSDPSSSTVEASWMNSPGHKANILDARFTEVGFATCQGEYQGKPVIFVVEHFMQPSPQALATSQTEPSRVNAANTDAMYLTECLSIRSIADNSYNQSKSQALSSYNSTVANEVYYSDPSQRQQVDKSARQEYDDAVSNAYHYYLQTQLNGYCSLDLLAPILF